MARRRSPEIEYILFPSERVPSLNLWTTMMEHDFLSFGQREYLENQTGAMLKVLWLDIRISKPNGFKIVLKNDITAELAKLSKAKTPSSKWFSGIALYGCFNKLKPEYEVCVDSLSASIERKDEIANLKTYDEHKKFSLKIVELCLRSYNNLMDAYRLARLFGACEKLVIQPCIHDKIELTSALGPWELVHQTRRMKMSDFVQTCFVRPRGTRWIPGPGLCFVAPSLHPPKEELQNLIQEFLEHREYDWCLHLIDSIEFLLEGDLSRAVIAGNIAIEVAVKEAFQTFLRLQGARVGERDLKRFFKESSLSSQIKVLLPILATGVSVDPRLLSECNALRNARHAILHWGHGIKNTEAVLRWLNAARELCLALHGSLNSTGES